MELAQYRHTVNTPMKADPREAVHFLTVRDDVLRRACDIEGVFHRATQHPALVSCSPCVESDAFRKACADDYWQTA